MSRWSSVRAAAAVLIALGTAVACGNIDVVSPSTPVPAIDVPPLASRNSADDSREHPYTHGSYQQSFRAATCTPHGAAQSSGVFGPAGGTLFFGDSRLIIPGGALRGTVTISATIPVGASSRVEFAPSGLQFNKPAGLILSTVGCVLADPNVPSIVYLSADGEILETIPAVFDPHWKTIAAPIEHFSGYAIAF